MIAIDAHPANPNSTSQLIINVSVDNQVAFIATVSAQNVSYPSSVPQMESV